MGKTMDLSGMRFGRLLVLKYTHNDKFNRRCYECQCDCGKICSAPGTNLKRGDKRSCGCLYLETMKTCNIKHGHAKVGQYTKEFRSWASMKNRCLNTKNPAYKNYGGRGIKICDAWLNSFEQFFSDMGQCSKGCSIERVNNDLGYNKDNCIWADRFVQANNTRKNVFLTRDKTTLTTSQWARNLGVDPRRIEARLKRGATVEEALASEYKPRKTKHKSSNLTPNQIRDIISMREKLTPYGEIAKKYNRSISGLEKVVAKAKKEKYLTTI